MLVTVRRLPALLLPVVVLTALTACGDDGGGGSATGRVTDVERRLCVSGSEADQGRCFTATPDLLAGLAIDDCITLDYSEVGDGRLSEATGVRQADGC